MYASADLVFPFWSVTLLFTDEISDLPVPRCTLDNSPTDTSDSASIHLLCLAGGQPGGFRNISHISFLIVISGIVFLVWLCRKEGEKKKMVCVMFDIWLACVHLLYYNVTGYPYFSCYINSTKKSGRTGISLTFISI